MKFNEDLDLLDIFKSTIKNKQIALAYYATVMDVKIKVSKTKALKYKYKKMKASGLEYITKNWSK